MDNVKLLIVDDDEDDYLLACDLLEDISHGAYQVDWAPSFEQGRQLLSDNVHDLCLMDYQLGARDGIELLQAAQECGFSGPVILLTGMHQKEVDMQALAAGAVDYLVKAELTAEQLARSIRYALSRREMEHERVERLKAEAENRSKSEFLAHLSHELRTPLSAILGFTELLITKSSEPEYLNHLQVVHRNGKHLLGLLNDILDLSKIEAGKLELEYREVYLSSFLTDIYVLMLSAARDKSLNLSVECGTDLPHSITTDSTRLRQILLNLIGNAIKFTEQGEVTLKVSLIEAGSDPKLEFQVSDTGIGIRQEVADEIFQPFVQAKNSYTEPRAGTGLGLAISQQLANRLGGEIKVQSEPGVGSQFTFSIDVGNITDVERSTFELCYDEDQHQVAQVEQLVGKALVVDDLPDIRQLVGHFIGQAGIEVVYAKNGAEAVRVLQEDQRAGGTINLVVMDIHMPVMDGHQAAQLMRELKFEQPLVALTAAHMKGDMDKCLLSGFTDYISKPVDRSRLHATLQKYLPQQEVNEIQPSNRQHLLLVEDDADSVGAIASLLELLGWVVTTASSAADTRKALAQQAFDVVLTDLNLPDAKGTHIASTVKQQQPGCRVVLLSGAEISEETAQSCGIDLCLLKPAGIEDLKKI